MSALLNTLLAALFPAILAPQEEIPASLFPDIEPVVTVKEEPDIEEFMMYICKPA